MSLLLACVGLVMPQVDHEPSVPTLQALLLSCLAFAAVRNLEVLLASSSNMQPKPSLTLLLQAVAAFLAAIFEIAVRGWCKEKNAVGEHARNV